MRRRTPPIFALLLATLVVTLVHAVAVPGGGESTTGKKKPTLIPNEAAHWKCTHKYKVMYSHYKLSGSDWNKTEEEIKLAVSNAGIITRWQYNEEENEHGGMNFESSVSQPSDADMHRLYLSSFILA